MLSACSQAIEAAKSYGNGHRQRGGLNGAEAGWNVRPVLQDREIRCSRAGSTDEVDRSEHRLTRDDVLNPVADRIYRSGNLQSDSPGKISREQTPAESPIRRVKSAGVHALANAIRTRVRKHCFFHSQYVRGFAVLMEAHGQHGVFRGIVFGHHGLRRGTKLG